MRVLQNVLIRLSRARAIKRFRNVEEVHCRLFSYPSRSFSFNKSFHPLAPFAVTLAFSDQGSEYSKII